ncbi:Integrase core domain protein [Piscirickettsia salmonis]|nr:Integrase core domain protein [Piscirickettsia salmonis]QGN82440.1 Integrase core domain protein [Piscirickettsia salmonis]QGN86016.1 Integrase core domain protein [Piscirickettsia salmonis]QGN89522.1 Integrase core domain protein [Piscirickettsia salmonis]QGN93076.1 Integrase core domain protein [Piscirickettsia salmonis]
MLTEEQLQALEKAKQEKEAHGEIETEHPGYLGSQDTYYVGTMKGVGRIYQQTFVDTYSRVAFACLYTEKNAVTAAHALNESVIPWFEERDTPLLRILTDRRTEYCGKIEHHAYQLYLAIEDVDHTRTKARSPQTNGICERFHRTMKQEFYDIAFRKKVYNSLEELQVDVDEWLIKYNQHRSHSGKYCYGKTPMQTFQDSKHLAQEKIINKNVQSDSLINQTNVVR